MSNTAGYKLKIQSPNEKAAMFSHRSPCFSQKSWKVFSRWTNCRRKGQQLHQRHRPHRADPTTSRFRRRQMLQQEVLVELVVVLERAQVPVAGCTQALGELAVVCKLALAVLELAQALALAQLGQHEQGGEQCDAQWLSAYMCASQLSFSLLVSVPLAQMRQP
jgi:hypothetical protein